MHVACPCSDTWKGWEHFQRMKILQKAGLRAEGRLGERYLSEDDIILNA